MRGSEWFPADKPGARLWLLGWLGLMVFMVYAMILVGGATRLTDSGLSITEWKPLSGALPPLSASDWQSEFEKYRSTTQYQALNRGMSLADFQVIYWWEWGHRQLGRALGIVFLLPFLVFLALRWITPSLGRVVGVAFVLGGIQAAIGWWMVASGLGNSDRVSVAPYRLMTHFSLALLILAILFWGGFGIWRQMRRPDFPAELSVEHPRAAVYAVILLVIVALQMALGALVAGLDAGRTYTDWPLMAGRFIPLHYGAIDPWWRDPFENMASAQFHHRMGGYILLVLSLLAWWRVRTGRHAGAFRLIAALCVVQMALGILTILNAAPVSLALLHQGVGVLLWLAAVAACFLVREGHKLASGLSARNVSRPDALLSTASPPSA